MQKYLLIVLFLLSFSCNKNDNHYKILSEKKLTDILVDIHVMDGFSNKSSFFDSRTNIDSLTIYNSVFKKHNVTSAEFDSSIHWYTLNPKKFSKIYDNVFANISKLEQDTEDNLALFQEGKSNTIWQIEEYIIVNDTLEHNTIFEVPIEKRGTYLLNINIRILPEDQSVDPKLLAYFTNEGNATSDSIPFAYTNISKSNYSQDLKYTATIKENSKKTLKIVLPYVKNTKPFYRKNYQITSIRVMLSTSN